MKTILQGGAVMKEDFGLRRKKFLELCETHEDVHDDAFTWGTFKIFWGRMVSHELAVDQFLQWKEVTSKKEKEKKSE